MENKSSLWKSALNWGVIMGIVMIIYNLIMFFLDLSLEQWVGWVSYIVMIAIIVVSTINYRDKVLGGAITYGQALGFGVMVVLFSSIISSIYTYVFVTVIDPEFANKILAMTEQKMVAKGIPEQQIEAGLSMQKKFMSPIMMSVFVIPVTVFFGCIFSLITSAFLKKNRPAIQFNEGQ